MLSLAAGKEPIRCCEPVLGDLWVGRGNRIILVDTHMLTFQTLITLPVTSAIQSMVCVDQGVWLFVENSPTLYLYHASSGKLLSSVDCTSAVSNVLSSKFSFDYLFFGLSFTFFSFLINRYGPYLEKP